MTVSVSHSIGLGNRSIGEIVTEQRGQLLRLAAEYGLSNLRIYSPEADGCDSSQCNLLLLVDVADNHNGRDTSSFVAAVEAVLGCNVTVEINKTVSKPEF